MALTMEWSASDRGDYSSNSATATLKKYDERLGILSVREEYSGGEVRLTAQELRELATMATALASEIESHEPA